ncbi:MAG: plasmid pRiA4b ORF-3 family protein, partial [Trebonia sp.]
MPKIPETAPEGTTETAEDMLRALLEQSGQSLDGRLRKILESQTYVGSKRVPKQDLPEISDKSRQTIHRVKVSLYGAKPPIWRRLELPSDMGLDLVHEALQTVFGWFDCHYHQFETVCGEFGDPAQNDDVSERDDESAVALAQVAREAKDRVVYVYDFGDDWRHDIVVE